MKNSIIGIVAVVALVLSGYAVVNKPASGVTTVYNQPQDLGGASSPNINGGCVDLNGVVTCYATRSMTVASSTVCSVQSPSATSTLLYASAEVASTSATAAYLEFGRGTSYFATTTLIGSATISANVKGATYVVATTTSSGAATVDGAYVVPASNYVVVRSGGTTGLGGTCKFEFRVN